MCLLMNKNSFRDQLIIVIIFVIHSSSCYDESIFHCYAKPGWNWPSQVKSSGRSQFPMSCKFKSTEINDDINLKTVKSDVKELKSKVKQNSRKYQDIRTLRLKMEALEEKAEKNSENLQELERLKMLNQNLENELLVLKASDDKLKKEMQKLRNEVKELRQTIGGNTDLEPEETDNKEKQIIRNCRLEYKSKCFWPMFTFPLEAINFEKAQEMCNSNDWKLANIYDEAQYRFLERYLRSRMLSGWKEINMWIGLTYKDNKLLLPSEDEIILPKKLLHPNYPYPYKSRTNTIFLINKVEDEKLQGIFNAAPTSRYGGVICES